MNASIYITRKLSLGPKSRQTVIDIIAYLFIFLFLYTAYSKFSDLESFRTVLAASPLVGSFAGSAALAVPTVEAIIAALLIAPAARVTGLRLSLALMLVFTGYLIYMVLTASALPCNCGGVINSMSWTEHIFFNAGFTVLAMAALLLHKQQLKIH